MADRPMELDGYGVDEEFFAAARRDSRLVGLEAADLAGPPERAAELIVGERCAQLARVAGAAAYRLLFHAQWGYGSPDWFDHRLHVFGPAAEWTDFWTMSADNVLAVLPLGGSVLSLCAGDAFYERWFFLRRAAEVVCVDRNPACHRHYLRLHQAPGLTYHLADALTYAPPAGHFDVVVCRGAIEHFVQPEQQRIFEIARDALRPGGWFCGDTPAARDTGAKMLDAHEYEWHGEGQARAELGRVFGHVETLSYASKERTTLFWRARKEPV